MDKLTKIYQQGLIFTETNHPDDLEWIKSRQILVPSFNLFFEEYCYCVVASGFKGAIAGQLAPLLAACNGDYEKSILIFKNKQKVRAICTCYEKFSKDFSSISKDWKVPEDLIGIPYIGKITCYHLARNIGLQTCVKPDLHLVNLIEEIFGSGQVNFVQEKVEELAKNEKEESGVVDFVLWIYMSHKRGIVGNCCGGKVRLR